MKPSYSPIILLVCSLAPGWNLSAQEVYKYTDETGQTVFTDQAPTRVEVEPVILSDETPDEVSAARIRERTERLKETADQLEEDRVAREREREELRAEAQSTAPPVEPAHEENDQDAGWYPGAWYPGYGPPSGWWPARPPGPPPGPPPGHHPGHPPGGHPPPPQGGRLTPFRQPAVSPQEEGFNRPSR